MSEDVRSAGLRLSPGDKEELDPLSPDDGLTDDDDELIGDDPSDRDDWVTLGYTNDKMTADYVIESLKSYEIEATSFSKSGYLGDIGLTGVASPFSGGSAAYQILVPAESFEEAAEIAEMVAGESWEPAEPE